MNRAVTCVSADWDVLKVRCKRNPSCELWDEEMLLEQQERDREPDRERVAHPAHRRPAVDPQPAFIGVFGGPANAAPRQWGRNEVDFNWISDPG